MTPLLEDIDAFIDAQSLTERKFGEDALNDKNLIPQLRAGRELRRDTERKVRLFMVTYRPAEQAAA